MAIAAAKTAPQTQIMAKAIPMMFSTICHFLDHFYTFTNNAIHLD